MIALAERQQNLGFWISVAILVLIAGYVLWALREFNKPRQPARARARSVSPDERRLFGDNWLDKTGDFAGSPVGPRTRRRAELMRQTIVREAPSLTPQRKNADR